MQEHIRLFEGISSESIQAMMDCFKPEIKRFRRGETVLVYSQELENLCIVLSGKAHLYCMDSDGEYTVLEQYGRDDIFGEVFAMPSGTLGYAVEADGDCSVMFIRFACVYGRCPKACAHHTRLTRNLFELSAEKAQSLSMRINMISKRSMRSKLLSYFEHQRDCAGSDSFELDIPFSRLAGFVCVERSSMMRELKNMCDDGIIRRDGRKITVLTEKEK